MILRLLRVLLIAYVIVLIILFTFQRHLLYFPQKYDFVIADSEFRDFEEVILNSEDGAEAYIWQKIISPEADTVIYFHGNGETLPDAAIFFRKLSNAGFNVMGLEYRGYGKSTSSTTERGILDDARTVMEYAADTLPGSRIILYGRSLGTGVAARMAAEYEVGGVVLHSPFTSVADIAADIYAYIPIHALGLVLDRFDSYEVIDQVTERKIFIVGTRDKLIPIENSQKLFAKARGPKLMVKVKNASHNTGYSDEKIISKIKEYFSKDEADGLK